MADKKFDLTEIMKEYGEDDFGFTATDEEEYNSVIAEKEETVEEYKQRLHEVEKLVLPFLTKLLKTADQPIIKWPNRKATLETKKKYDEYLAQKKSKEVWELVQKVTGVQLHKSVHEEKKVPDSDILPPAGAGNDGTTILAKKYKKDTPGQ